MHSLTLYIKAKSISQAAFAAKLDPPVSQPLISQWISGTTEIPLRRAFEIERITMGKVPVGAWDIPDGR